MQHASSPFDVHPTYQQIAERAYALYVGEGCPGGRSADHWRLAEDQLLSELRQPEARPASPQPARAGHRRKGSAR